MDRQDQAKILRYIPLAYKLQIQEGLTGERSRLPKLLPGEKLIFASGGLGTNSEEGGAYIYMNSVGDLLLNTFYGAFFMIHRDDILIEQNAQGFLTNSAAGQVYLGSVKRYLEVAPGIRQYSLVKQDGESLNEFRFTLVETSLGIVSPEGLCHPLFDITIGTKVSNSGEVQVSEDGSPVTLEMLVSQSDIPRLTLVLDKQGNVVLKSMKNVTVMGRQIALNAGRSQIAISPEGTIQLISQQGNSLLLNDSEGCTQLTDQYGNTYRADSDGVTIADKQGNLIVLDENGVTISAAKDLMLVAAENFVFSANRTILGQGPEPSPVVRWLDLVPLLEFLDATLLGYAAAAVTSIGAAVPVTIGALAALAGPFTLVKTQIATSIAQVTTNAS
jgi:hypothetical protein